MMSEILQGDLFPGELVEDALKLKAGWSSIYSDW